MKLPTHEDYLPLYAKAVVKTEAYRRLVELRDSGKNLMLIDFEKSLASLAFANGVWYNS